MSQAERTILIIKIAIPAFCILTCACMYLVYIAAYCGV